MSMIEILQDYMLPEGWQIEASLNGDWVRATGPKKRTITMRKVGHTYTLRSEAHEEVVKGGGDRAARRLLEWVEGARPNPAVSATAPISRADYRSIFGDADQDSIPDVDDPHPYEAGDTDTVEEVQLAKEVGKLIDMRPQFVAGMEQVMDALRQAGGPQAKVKGRVKTPFSIINKLIRKRLVGPHGLTDIAATMVILPDTAAVKRVVEEIRRRFVIVDFEDFYTTPQAGYRAYHAIVQLPESGQMVEVQIKSRRMAAISAGAHTPYKHGNLNAQEMDRLTSLAAQADAGDARAARQIDALISEGESALQARLTARTAHNPARRNHHLAVGTPVHHMTYGSGTVARSLPGDRYEVAFRLGDVEVPGYSLSRESRADTYRLRRN